MGPGAIGEGKTMYKNLSAWAGWGTALGKVFWAGVAEGGGKGEFCLVPPVQESRNLCPRVEEQNYTRGDFCSEPQSSLRP